MLHLPLIALSNLYLKPVKRLPSSQMSIHFDYTDGSFVVCPKQLDVLYTQIKHYQRLLARKRQANGRRATRSNQYFKVRTKLQKCYKRVTNIQNDLLHKFTTNIYHKYDTVVIENLDVKAMQMSKKAKKSSSFHVWTIPSIYGI